MTMNFMSDDISKLATALSKTQVNLKNVTKDKKAYNYKYADLATCLDAIREPFAENALSITQLVSIEDGQQVLITLLMHESGQWLKSTFILKSEGGKGTNDMQAFGSGMTYARRYALSAMCGLSQEDDDGASSNYTNKNTPVQTAALPKPGVMNHKNPTDPNVFKLNGLCSERGFDVREFAKYFEINSKDPELLRDAVEDFATKAWLFENHQKESAVV